MKTSIIALTLTVFLVAVPFAFARGNHRFAIDQQWKRVEAWQKSQDRMFKRIERDAAGETKSPASETDSDTSVWRDECPECGG
jgi:hypothetical protein